MLNNGKFFFPPPNDGSDFKELFKRLAAAGAGRPLGGDGFPAGPWTPELLAEAISEIDSNRVGVDLRTVQLWFQENEKGISPANIRWLARIFGCDDPIAISEWQMELSAAQSRLTAKRRGGRRDRAPSVFDELDVAQTAMAKGEAAKSAAMAEGVHGRRPERSSSLALKSEALFSSGSPLNLPAGVFAGVTALGFLAYVTGIHSIDVERADGITKQVGFLWAPNWTLLFMVLLPMFLVFAMDLIVFWRSEGRLKIATRCIDIDNPTAWTHRVDSSASTYWAVLLVCVVFAGVIQWVDVCLIPLIKGGGDYAIDWGKIALVRPDVISVPEAVLFTGLSYFYMALCFYVFFVGLILLHTIVHDFSTLEKTLRERSERYRHREVNEVGFKVIGTIFRCTVLGVMIGICMKLQSSYLTSTGKNIGAWLVDDISSALFGRSRLGADVVYRMPTHYSSLLVVVSTCTVFSFACVRLRIGRRFRRILRQMATVVALLVTAYILIGAVPGFSIPLTLSVLCALYGLVYLGSGRSHASEWEPS